MEPQAKKKIRFRDTSRRLLGESNLLIIHFIILGHITPNLLKNEIKNYRKLVINDAADCLQL